MVKFKFPNGKFKGLIYNFLNSIHSVLKPPRLGAFFINSSELMFIHTAVFVEIRNKASPLYTIGASLILMI